MKFLLPYREGTILEKYAFYFSNMIIDWKYNQEQIYFIQLNIDNYNKDELKQLFQEADYILLNSYFKEFKEEIYNFLSEFEMREKKLTYCFNYVEIEKKQRILVIPDIKNEYYKIFNKLGRKLVKDCYFSNVFDGGVDYKQIPLFDNYGIYQFPKKEDAIIFAIENKEKLIKETQIEIKTAMKYLKLEKELYSILKIKKTIERKELKLQTLYKQLEIAKNNSKEL
ncbi:hypothetical protein [Cetobacterium sp.]|uniref:hypothetical protein n=1 Tax=Cetobacterium sp. TaxID=2071632 RepID=UPI003F3DA1D0